jgi:Rad3-related DNA helicase
MRSPAELGFPSKFKSWRPNQEAACQSILETKERFLIQACPTGFGKSLAYMAAALESGTRVAILTSTKGLQTQLVRDFGKMKGVVDIRGRMNYQCRLNTKVSCDTGVCVFGVKCPMKEEGGCFYYDQLRAALSARVVITNYAYWMAQNEYSEGLGEFGMLILDEAHSAPDHLLNHVAVTFGKSDWNNRILELGDSLPTNYMGWKIWAEDKLHDVKMAIETAKVERKEKKFLGLKKLEQKLGRITDFIDSSWLWEDNPGEVSLTPTWPAPFSEHILFTGVRKIVLTSATVVAKTAALLGIRGGKSEEYPHEFPVENRPLIHVPSVNMNWRNGEAEHRVWLMKMDQIIRDRVGTKGIIHTVSYARRDMVLDRSKYGEFMVTHNRLNTEATVRAFKRSDPPSILVSPSMATGWDFPYDECRWQIIIKLPYPDMRGEIMRVRGRKDSDYINYLVSQQLIQATGRGVRAKDDWCETFVIDNNVVWFIPQNRHLMLSWFTEAYRKSNVVPKPPDRG